MHLDRHIDSVEPRRHGGELLKHVVPARIVVVHLARVAERVREATRPAHSCPCIARTEKPEPVRRPDARIVRMPLPRRVLRARRRVRVLKHCVNRLRWERRVEHEVLADHKAFLKCLTRDHVPKRLRYQDSLRRVWLRGLDVASERPARAQGKPHIVRVVNPVEPVAGQPAVVATPRQDMEVRVRSCLPQSLEHLRTPSPRIGLTHVEPVREEHVKILCPVRLVGWLVRDGNRQCRVIRRSTQRHKTEHILNSGYADIQLTFCYRLSIIKANFNP